MNAEKAGPRPFVSALGRPMVVLLFLQLMGGMMLSPQRTFFPVYLQELGYSAIAISTIASAGQIAGLLASLAGGALSDVLGRKWTLLAGEIGFVLGSLVFLGPDKTWIAIMWTASGFGLGLHTLGGQSYLMDAAPIDRLGMLSALYNWGYTLGGALSSPIAGYILDHGDYGALAVAMAGFGLLTLGLNLTLLPGTWRQAEQSRRSRKQGPGYAGIAGRPSVMLLALMRFLPTFYWGMALVLIPLLLNNAQASKTEIALYAAGSQVIAALAQIVTGRTADRLGIRGPTLGVLAALTAGILGIAAAPRQAAALYLFGTLTTAAAWSLSTLLPLWAARVAEPQERGRVLGWVHLWWNGAMIAGSMAAGPLLARSPSLPFVVAGTLNAATIGLALLFLNQKGWKV